MDRTMRMSWHRATLLVALTISVGCVSGGSGGGGNSLEAESIGSTYVKIKWSHNFPASKWEVCWERDGNPQSICNANQADVFSSQGEVHAWSHTIGELKSKKRYRFKVRSLHPGVQQVGKILEVKTK